MLKQKLYALLLAGALTPLGNAMAQCNANEYEVVIEISPDVYYYETSWDISSPGGTIYASGTVPSQSLYTHTVCVPNNVGCLQFNIYDSFGDGIYSPGYYTVTVDGNQIAMGGGSTGFSYQETTDFGCAPGSSCGSALSASLGQITAPAPETWYFFTPTTTGTYGISTCNVGNTCPTALWVYETCSGIVVTESIMGAVYFANNGCPSGSGAYISAVFEAGVTYIIRIGDNAANGCVGSSINWELSYVGPVVGCTDPAACNYNPLATVSDNSCIYPGNPLCGSHDLEVDSAALVGSFFLNTYANTDPCALTESCVTGYGAREVISFTMRISNIGSEDYYIGSSPATPSTPSNVFEYSTCHGHWHYKHYGKYTVFDAQGNEIPVGLKNGYCVMDLDCSGGGTGQYGCSNMGISAGCADIYGAGTTCQWIDATDLDTGFYYFIAEINWLQQPDAMGRVEESYDNNRVQVCFHLSRNAAGQASITVQPNCATFVDCNGVIMGPARPDCEGTCNGYKLSGDLDVDTVRTTADVDQYLAECILDTLAPVRCTDLNGDTAINVVDAALLQECVIHGSDTAYWGNGTPCVFPFGIYNPNHITILNMGRAYSDLQYAEVDILNPLNRVMGFEFRVDGLPQIDSVVCLISGYNPKIEFGQDGQIVGLDEAEQYIERNFLPTPFLRIYFSGTAASSICLGELTAFTNDVYEETDKEIGIACAPVLVSSINNIQSETPTITAIPNPFGTQTTLYFDNSDNQSFDVLVTDVTGRTVAQMRNLSGNTVEINRENWASGLYFVHLSMGNQTHTAKIVAY